MALFPYNSDPKYSVYDINNSQDFRGRSKRCDYIQIGLRLYSHLFCKGFIFHYFCIYLSILLSISSGSGTVHPTIITPFLLLNLKFPVECLYICSWVRFSVGYCIVCPSIYTIWLPLWYLQTFLIICCFFSFKLVCLRLVQFGAPICEPHQRTKMPRSKIKQDFDFTTLKGFNIIKLTTCDRLYNKKFVHLLRCLTLFLISFYRLNTCLLWGNIECSPLFVPIVNKTNYLPLTNVK